MVKPKLFAVALLASLPLLGVAGEPAAAMTRLVTIGTGGPTGIYFAVGNAICRLLLGAGEAKGDRSLRCIAPSSAGSQSNVDALISGDIDVAIVQSDVQYEAYEDASGKGKQLRSLFSLHAEPYQLVASKKSGIKSWNDLAGKRFNIGNPGSGNRKTTEVLMQAHGTPRGAFQLTTELPPAEQARALCSDRIDAFGYVAGAPNSSVASAIEKCDATLVSVDSPVEEKLAEQFPYFGIATIPKSTYKGVDNDVRTLSTFATVLVRADLPDDMVKALMAAVFDDIETFRSQNPALENLNLDEMVSRGLIAPLHPAAEAFLKEKGLLK